MSEALRGAEFKKQLREGRPKLGLFLNAHSPTVAEPLAHYVKDVEAVSKDNGKIWTRRPTALM